MIRSKKIIQKTSITFLSIFILMGMILFNFQAVSALALDSSPLLSIDLQSNSLIQAVQTASIQVNCDPLNLIDAINTANENPGADIIDLSGGCVYEYNKVDNGTNDVGYNALPLITSSITINGNGAFIQGAKDDLRALMIAPNAELTLNEIEFTGFESRVHDGTIFNQGSLNIVNSTFFYNNAVKGGAIYNDGFVQIVNSTFAENVAGHCADRIPDGGAIYNNGQMLIVNATFSNNTALGASSTASTIYNNGSINLKNSIITSDSPKPNCAGDPIQNGGGNLRWPSDDNTCVGTHADPKLAPLALNGGMTRTLALKPGSAAINTAIDSFCEAEPVNNTSQNDISRPFGPQCDIGAFELDYLVISSMTLVDPNPTNLDIVQFAVSFSKPVTGFDKSDLSLITTRISGATISTITGSGENYFVTVYTGSNSGTLQLVLHDNDSIQSLDGGYLGTAGVGNGDYLDGETYTVDKQAPQVLSINRVNSNPISTPIVNYKITFSKPVTGVDINDFQLSNSGLINAEILQLLGAEKTYTVTIDTGIGDGSLRLDLIDKDSIVDSASNPLGGSGIDNGNFSGQTYTIIANASFADVPTNYWAYSWIERLYDTGVTTGCSQSPLGYCPDQSVTRAEMAIFLERSKGTFNPPQGTGNIFADVSRFDWFVDWVELLYADEITTGCATNPLSFCPNKAVTRAEMALFILRTKYGADFKPPAAQGYFADVHRDNYWAADYIEQLYKEGITTGCGGGNYCPERPVTRAEMAAFIMRAFDLD